MSKCTEEISGGDGLEYKPRKRNVLGQDEMAQNGKAWNFLLGGLFYLFIFIPLLFYICVFQVSFQRVSHFVAQSGTHYVALDWFYDKWGPWKFLLLHCHI